MRRTSAGDALIQQVDNALRTLGGAHRAARPNPAKSEPDAELTGADKQLAGRLMRVNHTGEVCAQALYMGQGLTSNDVKTRASMEQAAIEETDHLAWCADRLDELDTHPSYLNPVFFSLSFAAGAASGLMGNRFNLGFVAATEEGVVEHLTEHMERLPESDHRSRKILGQMRDDEDKHRTTALKKGGADFPTPAKRLMTIMSRVMTRSTYWV